MAREVPDMAKVDADMAKVVALMAREAPDMAKVDADMAKVDAGMAREAPDMAQENIHNPAKTSTAE